MFEDDDVIMPDDFTPEETSTPEEVETTDDNITEQQTEEVETTTTQTETVETPQTIKVKYNHEERDIPLDEATLLVQKGMNYDKAIERERQTARDTFIAELGYEWNGKPITTEQEYKDALKEQQIYQQYKDKDLPPEVIEELVEGRKFREEFKSQQKAKADEEAKNKQYVDFLVYYKQSNGKEYTADDTIPQEVVDQAESGQKTLKEAYIEHQNRELMNRIKVLEQNAQNAKKAPVSGVTIHGSNESSAEDDFLTGFNSI